MSLGFDYSEILSEYMFPNNFSLSQITHLDDSEIPDLIADACVSKKVVDTLRQRGYNVLYINEIDGNMPDDAVKYLGKILNVPIATHNVRHFLDVKEDLIPLEAKKANKVVNQALRYLSENPE